MGLYRHHPTPSIFPLPWFVFFSFQSISLCFFFFLIIFSHFLHPVGAVKWPIVKEQTVCVWDISCWFSGTLAWWMARQKTLNNSWFASRETCSLRLSNVQRSHLLCSASNDDFHSTVLQKMKPWVLYSSRLSGVRTPALTLLWNIFDINAYYKDRDFF